MGMYTLNQLQDELHKRYNQNIDLEILESCIHIWNIEPADTNNQGKTFFDEITLKKLYRGLKLKQEGYCESVIPKILNKLIYKAKAKCECNQEVSLEEQVIQKVEEAIKQKIIDDESAKESKVKELKYQTNPAKPVKQKKEIENSNKPADENPMPKQNQPTPKLIDMLSDNISEKVSKELLNYLQNGELVEELMNVSMVKRDNEILSKQVEELIQVNGELENRIFSLELDINNYKKIWMNLYYKFN